MTHRTLPSRPLQKKFLFGAVFLLLFFFFFRGFFIQKTLPSRVGIVIVGSPYRVVVWDRPRGAFTSILVPDDAVIDIVHGYGRLPVRSLLRLDVMEKQHGRIIRETMSDAVGFPIDYHLVCEDCTETGEERLMLRRIFSIGKIIPILFSQAETNIGWYMYAMLSRSVSIVSNQSVFSFSADAPGVLTQEQDPDGSVVRYFNGPAFDVRLGTRLEDSDIGLERKTVAFFNASDIPGLAQKAVRLVEKSGVHVVFVGNRSDQRSAPCVIEIDKQLTNTKTVQFIKRNLGCSIESSTGDGNQADIQVVLYPQWGERYFPLKK